MPRYDPFAGPTIDEVRPNIPAYVTACQFSDLVAAGGWRRVCELNGSPVCAELGNGAWVRPREGWGARHELEACIEWWMARKMRAPSSPSGLAQAAAPAWYRRQAWSSQSAIIPYLAGGWQEAQHVGTITGPHRVYDLRRAYRWALTSEPLPARPFRNARAFTPTRPGLHTVHLPEPWPGAPWPLRDGGTVVVETPGDFERFGTPPGAIEWLGGMYWNGTQSGEPLGEIIDSIPCSAVARAYWGPWAATTPMRNRWASGKMADLRPMTTNAVLAHCITARVRRRLLDVQTHYRYVDAVIVPEGQGPPTGDAVGDWREVRRYDAGVWIGWPGAYGPAGGVPDRLAGIQRKVG